MKMTEAADATAAAAAAQLTELQNEQSTLNRVSHRLAMTDAGPALGKVLSLLLPRLLVRIGKNDDAKKLHRREREGNSSSNNNNSNKRKLSGEEITTNQDNTTTALHGQIDAMHDTIHKKLIEMLTHTTK